MHSLTALSALSGMRQSMVSASAPAGSSLLTGLEVYYPLSSTADSVGSRTLTNTNTVTFTTGKVGNAASFSQGNWLTRASDTTLQTGGKSFTLACWFKRDISLNSGDCNIAEKGGEWAITYLVSGDPEIQFRTSGSFQWRRAGLAYDTNWHLVMCWVDEDANTFGLQIDNGAPVTGAFTSYSSDANALYIGGFNAFGYSRWKGLIDEFGYWSRVLTTNERTALYNSGSGVTYPF